MFRQTFTALGAAAVLAACGQPLAGADAELGASQQGIEIGPLYDYCANASPDVVRHVGNGYDTPISALPYRAESGSGAYGYGTDLCKSFIVDAKLAQATPQIQLSAGAWDLPSSSAANGIKPSNAEDCARYSHSVRYYHRKGDTGAFTSLGGATFKGSWSAGTCTLYVSSGSMATYVAAPTPGAGWDYYRTVLRVKQRTSYQEGQVTLAEYIEPPA